MHIQCQAPKQMYKGKSTKGSIRTKLADTNVVRLLECTAERVYHWHSILTER